MTKTEVYQATQRLIITKHFYANRDGVEDIERASVMNFAYQCAMADLLHELKIEPDQRMMFGCFPIKEDT